VLKQPVEAGLGNAKPRRHRLDRHRRRAALGQDRQRGSGPVIAREARGTRHWPALLDDVLDGTVHYHSVRHRPELEAAMHWLLVQLLPAPGFRPRFTRRIAAEPAQVWAALFLVTYDELPVTRLLLTARSGGRARLTGPVLQTMPLTVLGRREDREAVIGRVAKFLLAPPPPRPPSTTPPGGFPAAREPGGAKPRRDLPARPGPGGPHSAARGAPGGAPRPPRRAAFPPFLAADPSRRRGFHPPRNAPRHRPARRTPPAIP